MNSLFHAYIVTGKRESAKAHIEEMLSQWDFPTSGNRNMLVSEHVTFTIDNARTLKQWQELAPAGGEHKVYVAYADFITRDAENALLKTLEEPIAGTHIFIAVPNPDMLLPTLLSRVRIISPAQDIESSLAAKKFLQLSMAERLGAIGKMIEKDDSEDASALVREKALTFIALLEAELSKDVQTNAEKLERILELKKYLYIPGASVRIILETIALCV